MLRHFPVKLGVPGRGGEPVFAEPWEARAFAVVVNLHDRGVFAWADFQRLLIARIQAAEHADRYEPYYLHWLAAAEQLMCDLELIAAAEIDEQVEQLRPADRTATHRLEQK